MKKIIALLLIAVLMVTLTGCFGKKSSSSTESATEPPALSTYTKDFWGLQQYLVDYSLVPAVKLTNPTATASEATPAEAATTATEATSEVRTSIYAELVGADQGARFLLNGSAFIEIYDFSNADNEIAKRILAEIKENSKKDDSKKDETASTLVKGTFTVVDGLDELTGVISKSGKYVIAYNASNSYEYDTITKVLENW